MRALVLTLCLVASMFQSSCADCNCGPPSPMDMRPADLAKAPDLAQPPDLSEPPDLAMPVDLSEPGDLA